MMMLQVLLRLPPTVWVTSEEKFAQLFWLVIFAVQAPMLGPHACGMVTRIMAFVGFWEAIPSIGDQVNRCSDPLKSCRRASLLAEWNDGVLA